VPRAACQRCNCSVFAGYGDQTPGMTLGAACAFDEAVSVLTDGHQSRDLPLQSKAEHKQPQPCYLAAMSLPPELIRFFGRLTTKSVLAPLSVPGGLIGAFALLLTPVAGPHHPLTYALWIAFLVWMFGGIGGAYIYWVIRGPDRLQTESYLLEQQRIKMIGDERDPGKVVEGTMTANTAAPMVARSQ
jgi:hypothetical protein